MSSERLKQTVLRGLNRRHTCNKAFYWRVPDSVNLPTFRMVGTMSLATKYVRDHDPEIGAIQLQAGVWCAYVYSNCSHLFGLDEQARYIAEGLPRYGDAARILTSLCTIHGLASLEDV